MAEIQLVDISDLNETLSRSKDMWIAVEIPGQGMKKIKKENFFRILGMVLEGNTTAGISQQLGIDGEDFGIYYLTTGGIGQGVYLYNKVHFTPDGIVSKGISIDAATASIIVRSLSGNNQTLTLDDNSTGDKDAYLGTSLDQQVVYESIGVDSTVSAKKCQRSLMAINCTSTISALTVEFPTTPDDGYTFELSIIGNVTTVTNDTGTDTIDKPIISVTSNANGKWVFYQGEWKVLRSSEF